MKIAAVSDLHGHLPEIPECDLLLLGGDYSPDTKTELQWLNQIFKNWLYDLRCRGDIRQIVGVAGNHDIKFEKRPELIPTMSWTYLQDDFTHVDELKIYGSPWQPRFCDWAFNLDEPELERKWSLIPDDTDILVLHGPPRGYGDFSPYGKEHTGSPSLLKRIQEIKPKLVVAGHIHSGHGRYMIGDTIFLNCSYVNEKYQPSNPVQVVEINEFKR